MKVIILEVWMSLKGCERMQDDASDMQLKKIERVSAHHSDHTAAVHASGSGHV
jgi:hypothetical protein